MTIQIFMVSLSYQIKQRENKDGNFTPFIKGLLKKIDKNGSPVFEPVETVIKNEADMHHSIVQLFGYLDYTLEL